MAKIDNSQIFILIIMQFLMYGYTYLSKNKLYDSDKDKYAHRLFS